MCWGAVLTTVVLACPPTRYVVYSNGPEMCCVSGVPAPVVYREVPCGVQTMPGNALVAVPVVAPQPAASTVAAPATAAVVQDARAVEAPATETAVGEELENPDGSVLENAAFGFPNGMALDRLALGWGTATIGNGTLYPNTGRFGGAGVGGIGGFGGGGSNGSGAGAGSSAYAYAVSYPPVWWMVPPPPFIPITPPPGNPSAVPEPGSIAIWGAAAGALMLWRRRKASA